MQIYRLQTYIYIYIHIYIYIREPIYMPDTKQNSNNTISVQYNTLQCTLNNTIQYNTVQYKTMYSKQYNTIQYNTSQLVTYPPGLV